jgi:hypothetical protein
MGGYTGNIKSVVSGQYVGDGSSNKPIAHGLGRLPALVIIRSNAAFSFFVFGELPASMLMVGIVATAVQSMSSSTFYVGNVASYPNTANDSGVTYYWAAFG